MFVQRSLMFCSYSEHPQCTTYIISYGNKNMRTNTSIVPCQKGLTRHAYAWQIGRFWQDTLDIWVIDSKVRIPTIWNMCNISSPTFSILGASDTRTHTHTHLYMIKYVCIAIHTTLHKLIHVLPSRRKLSGRPGFFFHFLNGPRMMYLANSHLVTQRVDMKNTWVCSTASQIIFSNWSNFHGAKCKCSNNETTKTYLLWYLNFTKNKGWCLIDCRYEI